MIKTTGAHHLISERGGDSKVNILSNMGHQQTLRKRSGRTGKTILEKILETHCELHYRILIPQQ